MSYCRSLRATVHGVAVKISLWEAPPYRLQRQATLDEPPLPRKVKELGEESHAEPSTTWITLFSSDRSEAALVGKCNWFPVQTQKVACEIYSQKNPEYGSQRFCQILT